MTKLKHLWNKRKGFTLIELIVVMAIIGILVLLAAPRFLGRTDDANATKHVSNARTLEDASERYYMDHGDWPRLTDDAYTSEQIHEYADKVRDITGEEVTLTEGSYYDIDYEALSEYVRVPDESDLANYVLRNPVGKVYHLEGLSEEGRERVPKSTSAPDVALDDTTNAPGPKTLIGGDMQAGFFGEVPASELITGDALASTVGIAQGVSQFSDTPWLKFAYEGNIQYVAKKTVRYSISWDAIAQAGAVYGDGGSQGDATVKIKGNNYKVRLVRGANGMTAIARDYNYHLSEWNRLMLPIHENVNNDGWSYPNNVGEDDVVALWGDGYSDRDLVTNHTENNGGLTWTQETLHGIPSSRFARGFFGVLGATVTNSSVDLSNRGWRPVLELVED